MCCPPSSRPALPLARPVPKVYKRAKFTTLCERSVAHAQEHPRRYRRHGAFGGAALRPTHDGRHRGHGQGHERRHPARRHREPHGAHGRGHPDRHHQRRRLLPLRQPAPRRLRPELHAQRVPQRQPPRPARERGAHASRRTPASRSASARSRSRWWRRRRWWTRSRARWGRTTTASWVENAPLRRFSFLDLVAAAPGSQQVAGRQRPHHGLRLVLRRELLPARRRGHHRELLQRVLGGAQHRRHRGGRGPVAGRARGVRQPGGGGLQHRDPAGHERVPRGRELLPADRRPDRQQQRRTWSTPTAAS